MWIIATRADGVCSKQNNFLEIFEEYMLLDNFPWSLLPNASNSKSCSVLEIGTF